MIKISIDKVLKDKLGAKAKYCPSFIVSLLERIIYQREINEILALYGDKRDLEFITHSLDHLDIKREVIGIEKLSTSDRYIIASNHPLGGLDGFAIAEAVGQKEGDIKLVVNDILMNVTPIKGIFAPINKHGRQKASYATTLTNILESDSPLLYFPAGLCSRKISGRITDLVWHDNYIKKAIKHKRDIIPIYVDCVNSNFFYNFALIRKLLKIKFNLEMVLLPHELFNKRGGGIVRIIIGDKISYRELSSSDLTIKEWNLKIRELCYALAENK